MKLPALAALLLSATLLISACSSEDPEPKIADEPSATPTVVKEETAEEFIRRWNDEQREMQKGDTTEYRKIAGECEPCMEAADQIDSIYAAGGYVKTEGRTVESIKSSGRAGTTRTYTVAVTSSPTEYVERTGGATKSFEGGPAVYDVTIDRSSGDWQVGFYIKVSQ